MSSFVVPTHRPLLLIAAFCTVAGTSVAAASEQNGGSPGEWLSQYTSARALGLGGAYVAATDEPLGVVWNPAGLSFMSQNQAHFEVARLFESTSIQSFAFAIPSRTLPSIGLTVLSLNSGDFERTNELNEPLGSFSEGDIAFLLSASKSLSPRLALGTNLKVVRQTVEDFGGTGFGADLGVLYDLTPSLRVGASFLNLGGPSLTLREAAEEFPAEFRVGGAMQIFQRRGQLTAELDHSSGLGTSLHGGAEYWLYPNIAMRAGYNADAPTGGFTYRLPSGLRFEYAFADEELGVAHRFGVSYRFGGFYADSQVDPPIFSPIGERSVTKIELKARTKADTRSWSLDITNKSAKSVRRFGGKGSPPAHVMWDGKDETGLSLPDGSYQLVLTVVDEEGREVISRNRTVEILTSGPQGSVPVAVNQD